MFDITDNVSFEKMKIWIREIEQFVKAKLEIGIVGNKTDLEHLRQVVFVNMYNIVSVTSKQYV